MTTNKLQISVLLGFLLAVNSIALAQYPLHVSGVDRDSATIVNTTGLQTDFTSRLVCMDYISKLPGDLRAKGFASVSVDSIHYDSLYASVRLFLGRQYKWAVLHTGTIDPVLLDNIGWREQLFAGKPMDFTQVKVWQEKLLVYLENNDYPFGRVYLDSLVLEEDMMSAALRVNKGPLYKIDSIRVYGNAKISKSYLQRYLGIPDGSVYSKQKILQVDDKLRELTYVEEEQPASLTLLGTGSVLNIYLKQKKSSQVNVLIGFLPNNDQLSTKKLLLTGEANILLKNALGAGETFGLNWQQLQVKSPRLHVVFNYPYLFHSPVGLDFGFDIFRKDSSFVNINLQLGAQYALNERQSGKLFIQHFQTYISTGGINEAYIIQTHRLPDIGDVGSFNIGVDYQFVNTDYRLNPKRGNEVHVITAIGSKTLKKNATITGLTDPSDPSFDFERLYDTIKMKTSQFRGQLTVAKYLPLGKERSTVKTALNAGIFESGNVFRNELFQLGGYKLLRGFDEESQYLSHYAIGTVEYRYLVGQNSFFYVLVDGGWGRADVKSSKTDYSYISTGAGLAFETKAGIFNLAWAVGKRSDTEFNLRKSKVHFGFVNYF